jgi:hypothetical protein
VTAPLQRRKRGDDGDGDGVDGIDILEATRRYESSLGHFMPLVAADLAAKHRLMADGPFRFLRATFYRWSAIWPVVAEGERGAARVLGVGDLHVENFGTWRDADGRMIWGINDFDEATRLPWSADLARLATSATLAAEGGHLGVSPRRASAAILDGYADGLADGGRPFVLEEHHPWLRRAATGEERDPVAFWQRIGGLPSARAVDRAARRLIIAALPAGASPPRFARRRAGMGSLGRPRFVGVADWRGGLVAREAKALAPSAWAWARGERPASICYARIVTGAVRVPDPALSVHASGARGWVVRRLAPHCARITLADLPRRRDEDRLLHAMGYETANVHLGTKGAREVIRRELGNRKERWLRELVARLADQVRADCDAWRRHGFT